MVLNSLDYVVFLAAVVLVYYILPHRVRWIMLLAVSYFFYMTWSVPCAALLAFSTLSTYGAALMIGRANRDIADETARKKKKKLWAALAIVINLLLLCFFKYTGFLLGGVQSLFSALGTALAVPDFSIVLPLGISFYTFKVVSYVIDVYRGKYEPQRHIGKYALYVSFFAQLISGPIARADHLMPQFDEKKHFDFEKFRDGLILILWGLFKKVVIADRLAVLVNTVYGAPGEHGAAAFITAAIFYTFQLYCDFSGYSDISIGSAALLGFDVKKNFDRPLFAGSIADFWRRWHISLTKWFTDYIYISMGGNRVPRWRWCLNVMVVFVVSGLWHGAGLTFIIWGALHGAFQIIGKFTRRPKDRLLMKLGADKDTMSYRLIAGLCTFALVTFAFVFFRAGSVADVGTLLATLGQGAFNVKEILGLGMEKYDLILSVMLIALLLAVEFAQRKGDIRPRLTRQWLPVRWTVYLFLIFAIIMFGVYGNLTASSSIYAQF